MIFSNADANRENWGNNAISPQKTTVIRKQSGLCVKFSRMRVIFTHATERYSHHL
jgi:hypothetical protein